MIQTVSFKNFKALRDLTISLERFTVLVGPNAAGKTSVLQGLDSLFFLGHNDPRYFSKERDFYILRSHGAPSDSSIIIRGTGTWAGELGQLELSLWESGATPRHVDVGAQDGPRRSALEDL